MFKKISFVAFISGTMLMLLFSSCNRGTKESFLENFSNFMSDVNTGSQNYSTDDWKNADKQFADLKDKQFPRWKDKLSAPEKAQVYLEIGNYEALKLKKEAIEVKGQVKDAINVTKSIINEVKGAKDSTKTK